MPFQIRIKRSDIPGGVPDRLGYGELAYNFADRVLYIGDRDGRAIVVANTTQIPGFDPPPEPEPPPDNTQNEYTTSGVRRRLLPFE
jgi:hypothetical protein